MLRSILKTLLRVSLRNRLFTSINLIGLSLGIASVLMILIWITHELSFDKHYEDSDQIYRVMSYGTKYMQEGMDGSPAILVMKSREVLPEVISATTFEESGSNFLEANGLGFYESNGLFCDTSFFEIFNYPFVHGSAKGAFNEVYSIILNETLAMKFFGRTDVINEALVFEDIPVRVSAVIKDLPKYSSLQFEYLISYNLLLDQGFSIAGWGRFMSAGYFKLRPDTDISVFETKLTNFASENNCPQVAGGVHFELQEMSEIHLDGLHNKWRSFYVTGSKQNIKSFSIIAFLILIIACFNYINLTTARMERRYKEVGIRKVVGSSRIQLIGQFIGESLAFSAISLILGFILVELFRPVLNNILESGIVIHYNDINLIGGTLGILLFTGVIAGAYPAFIQSRCNPLTVIKGSGQKGTGRDALRKALVFSQFFIASVLVLVSILFFRQTQFLQNKDLGFNKEDVLYIPIKENLGDNYDQFKIRLTQNQGVKNVSAIDRLNIMAPNRCAGCFTWESSSDDEGSKFDALLSQVDFDYFEALEIPIILGRSFSNDYANDSVEGFIVNEAAAKKMNLENPIDEYCKLGGYGSILHEGPVIGVVKDINLGSLKKEIDPQIYRIMKNPSSVVPGGVILIKYKTSKYQQVLSLVEEVWHEYNSLTPFEYYHLDESYDNLYKTDVKNGILVTGFTLLTILIACLGIFGMITFYVQRKTKEIAIRKTLGAETKQIIWNMTWSVSKWAVLAFLASIPVSLLISNKILETYVNKVSFNWWIYPVTFMSIFLIVIVTSLSKTIGIARMNLAQPLKYE